VAGPHRAGHRDHDRAGPAPALDHRLGAPYETPDRPDFYARTEALVKKLDPTRTTSGTMHGEYARTQVFQHDLFGYDDYHTTVGERGERRPLLLDTAILTSRAS
jgi:hypothetical protein